MSDTYNVAIDHSEDVEIRKSKDGKMFAVKNMRIVGDKIIADIGGNIDAGKEYLEYYSKLLSSNTSEPTS